MPKNSWDPERYDEDHSFVWRYAEKILQLLDPQPNERVLDLGCGTGHLTAEIAKAGASVVGIDQSSEMVSKAKSNYPDLDFEIADARSLPFKSDFDAVFSNAVLHWVRPPQKVVESVYTAAKPGGRFVAEFGAFGNINSILRALSTALNEQGVTEAESKFFYPRVASYKALLENQGMKVDHAEYVDRPTPLDGGEAGFRKWLEVFRVDSLSLTPTCLRDKLIARVEELARPVLFREGTWIADYKRIRIRAFKSQLGS